jgi:predicted ATPase/DNA-binding SARP family transcriptional activator
MRAAEDAQLRIKLFGRFEVWKADTCISAQAWSANRKTQALLKILLTQPGQVFTQNQLIEYLYPDSETESASKNLSKRVSELRKALEPDRAKATESRYIRGTGPQGYSFIQTTDCWIDTDVFDDEIQWAQAAESSRKWADARTHYQAALGLYTGDLLSEDLYEEWAVGPRERWRDLYLTALLGLAETYARLGQYSQAIERCKKAIQVKPTSEKAYRQQMLYHSLARQPSEALHVYRQCHKALRTTLNVEPGSETQKHYEALIAGETLVEAQHYPFLQVPATHNLPTMTTSFIGRKQELYQLRELLGTTQLLTLTGSGGSGKTRLAAQLAWQERDIYRQGIWWVELAPIANEALVSQAIASVLGIKEEAKRSLLESLILHLKNRHILLVLDNCEHLRQACAILTDSLLKACPQLQILATSRESLSVNGELIWRVPPLGLPNEQGSLPPPSILQKYEAIQLFTERVRLSQSQFELDTENASSVVEICQHLDGLPLAIELAAARVKHFSPEEIAKRLGDRFKLLVSGSKTELPHHQTLRSTMDWSYELLSEKEQMLWQRLSVFAGGWTLEAAEKVCSDEAPTPPSPVLTNRGGNEKVSSPVVETGEVPRSGEGDEDLAPAEIFDLLSQLVDKSIVLVEQKSSEARYRMLETVRQYSHEKLIESGELKDHQHKHSEYFLKLAETARSELAGADQVRWLQQLEMAHDNFRAALEWMLKEQQAEASLRLCKELGMFWMMRSYFREGRDWLTRALQLPDKSASVTRAQALYWSGALAYSQGESKVAKEHLNESLAIHRQIGNKTGMASVLNGLGNLAREQEGNYPESKRLHEESLALYRELGDKRHIASVLNNLGLVALAQENYPEAQRLYEESLALHHDMGNKRGIAYALLNLGQVVQNQGDLHRAQGLYEESLAIRRELGDKRGMAYSLINLGNLALAENRIDQAHSHLYQSLRICQEIDEKRFVLYSLSGFAYALALMAGGRHQRAAQLQGAIDTQIKKFSMSLEALEQKLHDQTSALLMASLGKDHYRQEFETGRAMSLEQAVAYALEELEEKVD